MPPKKQKRYIATPPAVDGFKPLGVPIKDLEPVILLFEEYESIRLCDYNGLNQEEAATQMQISRSTFTRIYEQARKTMAKAMVEAKAILIEGGDYHSEFFWYRCFDCYKLTISEREITYCSSCNSRDLKPLNNTILL